jgi:hypothetical protein
MAAETGAEYTVFNKPPYVNEILYELKPDALSARDFRLLVAEASGYDINTMLTYMTRELDVSGLVPNLAGVCASPQEVLKVMAEIGHEQLLQIRGLEPALRREVMDALIGTDCSLRALLVLDDAQRAVVAQLLTYRRGSELALAVRQAMEDHLRQLYRSPIKIRSEVFDWALTVDALDAQMHGIPRICYPYRAAGGDVREVWQYFHLPRLEFIHLGGHFSHLTVREVLAGLTPDFYLRGSKYDDHFDPASPVGFMGLLGKVGGTLPRMVVERVRRDSRIQALVQRDELASQALYELFTSYPQGR